MTYVERAILSFLSEGIALCDSLPHEEVVRRLAATGKPFSVDVVDFYCLTGGMENTAMSCAGLSIWSLPRVVFENRNHDGSDLAFADCLIDCWRYYFRQESESRSSVYGGSDGRKLADSVEEFFGKYLADPRCLDLMR